jgi:phage shock protein A
MNSQEERDRLKEEYKEHFRKIRETRERVKEAAVYQKVTRALGDLNADGILDSMGEMVDKLKEKIVLAEAKLELALESYQDVENEAEPDKSASHETIRKFNARESIQQIRAEMGQVYAELEKEAEQLRSHKKTVGRIPSVLDSGVGTSTSFTGVKTIGKPKETE